MASGPSRRKPCNHQERELSPRTVTDFDRELDQRMATIRGQGLYRELCRVNSPQGTRIQLDGQTLLNFSSNDYLGLVNDPALKEAALKAVE